MAGYAELERFQACHKACRDADAHEQAGEEEGVERFCFGKEESAERGEDDEHDLDGFRAVAIEQDTERKLAQSEREEVGGGEVADLKGIQPQLCRERRFQRSHERSVEHGERVGKGEQEQDAVGGKHGGEEALGTTNTNTDTNTDMNVDTLLINMP